MALATVVYKLLSGSVLTTTTTATDLLSFETHFSLGVVSHKFNPGPTPVKTRPSALDVSFLFPSFHSSP